MRIHLLEAEDLTAKDTVIKGLIDGKSDPYAVLRVGTQIFTSRHVDSNLNPQWREMYEVRGNEKNEIFLKNMLISIIYLRFLGTQLLHFPGLYAKRCNLMLVSLLQILLLVFGKNMSPLL